MRDQNPLAKSQNIESSTPRRHASTNHRPVATDNYTPMVRILTTIALALALACSGVTAARAAHPAAVARAHPLVASLAGNPSAPHVAANPSPTMSAADAQIEAALLYRLTHVPILPAYRFYITRPGDTVESIAKRFHDVAWLVRRRNGGLWDMAPNELIRVWQWPFNAAHWATVTYQTDRPQVYTIQPGDSLWAIALKLHTDIQTLTAENGLDSGATIYAGQRLVLHHYTSHQRRVWVPGVSASALHTGLLLTDIANIVGTDAALVKGLVWNESGWQMRDGSSGEIGMVQIMPDTARWVQRALIGYTLDPRVPENNILEGTLLLAYYLDTNHHDTHKALALYHSGDTTPNKRNGTYIRAVLSLRQYFYHHPRVGF
jgi:LysM repeat protein